MPNDSDGSAKVAISAIRRSMTAWKCLYDAFPEKRKTIHTFLADLESLRRLAERQFPLANDFIRPGLDENIADAVQ